MENCIENKNKKFNIFKSKVFAAITMLIVGFVMMMCFACNTNVYAATNQLGVDTSLYNDVKWQEGKPPYYIYRESFLFLQHKTRAFICVQYDNGELVPAKYLTRLEATYKENLGFGKYKEVTVHKEISQSTSFWMNDDGNGDLRLMDNQWMKKFKEYFPGAENTPNLLWTWSWKIEELVCLYAWYINPESGQETAISFMTDGAHPLYNDDGSLKGIFDVNNNLIEDMTLNENGVPSKIKKLTDGTTILIPDKTSADQQEDEKNGSNFMPFLPSLPTPGGNGDDSSSKSILAYIVLILELGILFLCVAAIIRFIKFIISLFK